METQIFHHAKIIIFNKSSERNQNPSRYYYNSVANLKFQTQVKISSFKNLHIKIDLLLPRDQNPLNYYTLSIMNLNTISLPTKARPIKDKLYTPTTMVVVCPHSTVVWIIHSLLGWLWIPSAIGIQSSGHAFWLYSLLKKLPTVKICYSSQTSFFNFFLYRKFL
jgi:hypothetical protein